MRHDPDDTETMTRDEWAALTAHAPVPPPDVEARPTVPLLPARAAWHAKANCRGVDPSLFFPEAGGDTITPKAVCAGCVVRADCLEAALARNEPVVWAGTSAQERKRIRRERSIAHAAATEAAAS